MVNWDWLADFIERTPLLLRTGEWIYGARRMLATVAMCLLIVFLSFHVVFGANGMLAYQRKRAEDRKLQQDVLRLQQENDRISSRIRELKSDPKAIEREAREQLKYTRPGEVVYVTPEPRAQKSTATAQKR